LIIDSSLRPVVTGVAYLSSLAGSASLREERSSYRPSFAGGASLCEERSSSRCVGTGVAYRPRLAGGASRMLFSIMGEGFCRPVDVGTCAELLDDCLLELDNIVVAEVS
jgi:hypothetical protein